MNVKKTLLIVFSLLFAFYCGYGLFSVRAEKYFRGTLENGDYAVYGVVESKTDNGSFFHIVLSNVIIDKNEQYGKLVAYLPATFSEKVRVADEVLLEGSVRQIEEFSPYSADENIRFEMTVKGITVVGRSNNPFLRFRGVMEETLYRHTDATAAALMIAVLTGNTDGVSQGLLQNMRYGGIAHVFAVSGLHVSALYGFCLLLMQKTKLRKLPKHASFLLTALVLTSYGAFCGFSASIIRATVICLLLLGTRQLGIVSDITENAGTSAIVVLLRSPFALFTVGFQLSFAAFLGIVWLSRPITNACYRLLEKFKKKEAAEGVERPLSVGARMLRGAISFLSVSLAAQIFTAPILLSAFEYLSGAALLLNCLFVPVLSASFSLLLLAALLSCVLPFLAKVFLLFPSIVWNVLTLLFEAVDFSKFCITGITVGGGATVLYFLALMFLTDKWNVSAVKKKVFSIILFLLFAVGMYALNA